MTSRLFPRPSNWPILLWLIVSTPYTVPLNAAPTFSENQNTSVNRVLASPIEVYFVDGSYMMVQSYEVREKLVLLLTPEGKLHSVLRSLVDMVATELGQQAILGESVSGGTFVTKDIPLSEQVRSGKTQLATEEGQELFPSHLTDELIDDPHTPTAPEVMNRNEEGKVTLRANRLKDPIELDGYLREKIYVETPSIEGFIQQEPLEGQPATERTEVWIFYDDSNVYFSARLWDSEPERIVASEMRRDHRNIEYQSSNFAVIIDTFYDRRNGYLFQTNPLGALYDAQVTDELNTNSDWNTTWRVQSGRFSNGWTLEMSIPFKSLRYRRQASQIWGINFQRHIKRKSEKTYLTQIPAAFRRNGLKKLSFAATLVGIETPKPSLNFEIKPYVIGSVSTDLMADSPYENVHHSDVGLDLKYGISKNLTFDFTYNTDFAQVEADESQVNLTRFSAFYPEKREFFLEGQGIFSFGGRQSNQRYSGDASDIPILFFSRRIGLKGSNEIPILAGARVTGRAGKYSIGLLNIGTKTVPKANSPQTNYSVVRVKRDILRRSNIGFLGTYRDLNSNGIGSNGVFGVDGNFAFFDNLNVNAYFAQSNTAELLGNKQSYRAAVQYRNDLYGFEAAHLLIDPAFNPEIGFVRRSDIRKTNGKVRYSPRLPRIASIRQLEFEGEFYYYKTTDGLLETKQFELETRTRFESGDFSNVTYTRSFEFLFEPFEISDEIFIPAGGYNVDRVRAGIYLTGTRPLSGWIGAEIGSFFSGTRTELTWRGRANLSSQISLEPIVTANWINLPEGTFKTNLIRVRATYMISPRKYIAALVQYNSETAQLTTNIRLRWEYKPESDIFIVYSDGRDPLMREHVGIQNRAFVVKVTRLLRH